MSQCLTIESPQQNIFDHPTEKGHTPFTAQVPDTMALRPQYIFDLYGKQHDLKPFIPIRLSKH